MKLNQWFKTNLVFSTKKTTVNKLFCLNFEKQHFLLTTFNIPYNNTGALLVQPTQKEKVEAYGAI
jgi:hypothetical protein